jgi:glycosyltransferase involved in cell wall biosynthesis
MTEDATAPSVSVIITAFNSGDFLIEALNSVLVQTHVDWELIVVDDGSHEAASAFIQKAVEGLPRKRLIRQQNRGVSAARNLGAEAARGQFLAFLDHDDIWEASFLEKMVHALSERPSAGALFCRIRHMEGNGTCTERVSNPPLTGLGLQHFLVFDPAGSGSAVAVRREAMHQVRGFDEEMLRAEMPEFFIRLTQAGWEVRGIPDVLVRYRNTPRSLAAGPLLGSYRRRIFNRISQRGEYNFLSLLKLRLLMEINQLRIQLHRLFTG